jgi:DNA-binding response OmpR family regulator
MVVSARAKRLFILILTEDDGQSQPLTLGLRASGHEVFVARSEDQAMRTLLVHASDVILIDTSLAGDDGYEVADRLCVAMRSRPVLVGMTGHDPAAERLRTHRFDHHIQKPVDVSALADFLSVRGDRRANGTRA